jgi:hypothetical protein
MTAEEPDPERLLADALRAQAVRTPMPVTPHPEPQPEHALPLLSGAEPGYGLLSGQESATTRGPATPYQERGTQYTRDPGTTRLRPQRRPLAAAWVLLLALVLGLAVGVAVGVLSVY